MSANRKKITIVQHARSIIDPNILVAYTDTGGRIELTPCVVPDKRDTGGQLYTNGKGLFFSLSSRGLHQVFDTFSPACKTPGRHSHNGKRGNDYPHMRHFGYAYCHVLVCSAYYGPRPNKDGVRYVCDHKNGCVTDYNKDNLEWVTPGENRRRSQILKVLRNLKLHPHYFEYSVLDVFLSPKVVPNIKVFEERMTALRQLLFNLYFFKAVDFRRWLTMPPDKFSSMLSKYHRVDPSKRMDYDLTHHMEE